MQLVRYVSLRCFGVGVEMVCRSNMKDGKSYQTGCVAATNALLKVPVEHRTVF